MNQHQDDHKKSKSLSLGFILSFALFGFVIALGIIWFVLPNQNGVSNHSTNHGASVAPETAAYGYGPVSYSHAVNRAAPAVVNIFTRKLIQNRPHPLFNSPFFQRFFDEADRMPQYREENSLGSGVIVSAQGHVLTNAHVIRGADQIAVTLRDGRYAEAVIVGTDQETDLALLRIDLPNPPVIPFGDSTRLAIGDVVLAIGNPYGVGQTVTSGIVSALERRELGINRLENFIQTDAAINPGNSGGALVNAHGDLIGISTAIFSESGGSQGIGFAIPLDMALDVMKQLALKGRVIRGWIGIEARTLTPELARNFANTMQSGILIMGVLRGGPAAVAGIRPGDVLTHIKGEAITSPQKAMELITNLKPGENASILAIRNQQPVKFKVQVIERPKV